MNFFYDLSLTPDVLGSRFTPLHTRRIEANNSTKNKGSNHEEWRWIKDWQML